jgi:acyl-CoA synthetase (NDP forming)
MPPDAKSAIAAMLRPSSIAVVGATDRLYGGRILTNLMQGGFKGKLYPVNPNREHVFGLRCYPSVRALPEPVDSAAILIPAPDVLGVLQECAEKGVKAAVIISAGFAELGDARGQQLQQDLRRMARETGVRVCGPNCLGVSNVADGIWTAPTRRRRAAPPSIRGPWLWSPRAGRLLMGPSWLSPRIGGSGFGMSCRPATRRIWI